MSTNLPRYRDHKETSRTKFESTPLDGLRFRVHGDLEIYQA